MLEVELIDRFGLLPQETKHLLQITEIKLKANLLGINKIRLAKHECQLQFNADPKINAARLIQLLREEALQYRMQGPNKLIFSLKDEIPGFQMQEVESLLAILIPSQSL